jgi:hypothetical protein
MAEHSKSNLPENLVHQALSGLPYPATKQDLIEYARARSDNGGVVDILEKLPEMEYNNEPQVLSTLKEYTDT